MTPTYDVLVIGLGAMGSAALWRLARRKRRVLGLDQFASPHTNGSSHGRSRIIREAYFEHPVYVPLVQRAYLLWSELERKTRSTLLIPTGGVMIGPAGGVLVTGAMKSAVEHGLRFEYLDGPEIHRRFPAFHPAPEMVGVWEPHAGVLDPEACVAACLAEAERCGAEVRSGEPVLGWKAEGGGVMVTTGRDTYRAARLVLAAGAWTSRLLPELSLPLSVERVVQVWLDPRGDRESVV